MSCIYHELKYRYEKCSSSWNYQFRNFLYFSVSHKDDVFHVVSQFLQSGLIDLYNIATKNTDVQ